MAEPGISFEVSGFLFLEIAEDMTRGRKKPGTVRCSTRQLQAAARERGKLMRKGRRGIARRVAGVIFC